MWRACIIFFAALIRVLRLPELSEFLGDQGRTMLIMRQFVESGNIPLSGPTTLSGHALGPAFYYLLVPGYLLTGGIFGVTYWIAVLGVVSVFFLYEAIRRMFGLWEARIVSLLYTVSPFIIVSDRTIWEPNLVPLFAILYVYFLYRAHREDHTKWWIVLGAVIGILVQLHYPNIVFIGLTAVYFLVLMLRKIKPFPDITRSAFYSIGGSVIVLLPFLIYEWSVGFRDLVGIAGIIKDGGGVALGKREMLHYFFDFGSRVFGRAIPNMSQPITVAFLIFWGVFVLIRRSMRNVFLTLWLLGGLSAMARYSGVVHDHYLYFLVPVPFFMIASVLSDISHTPVKRGVTVVLGLLILIQLTRLDIFRPQNSDIYRVSATVSAIRSDVGRDPFSFTLVGSKSFSDLHYRYYFDVMGLKPKSVTDPAFDTFYVACDGSICPSAQDLIKTSALPVLCYEEHCRQFYPEVDLYNDWEYEASSSVHGLFGAQAKLFKFHRPNEVR